MSTWQWPKRPKKLTHPILGRRERWDEQTGTYRVERFPEDGDPRFIALVGATVDSCTMNAFRVIGRHHTLKAAIRACDLYRRVQARKRLNDAAGISPRRRRKTARLTQSHLF